MREGYVGNIKDALVLCEMAGSACQSRTRGLCRHIPHLCLRPAVVDDDEEAMSPHRITDLRDQLSPPLRGSNLGKVDNGQISPLHYKGVSEAEDGKIST